MLCCSILQNARYKLQPFECDPKPEPIGELTKIVSMRQSFDENSKSERAEQSNYVGAGRQSHSRTFYNVKLNEKQRNQLNFTFLDNREPRTAHLADALVSGQKQDQTY